MDDLLREFLTETSESISTLDVELVYLEQDPNRPGLIDNIFRLVHTIKGTCGFLGLPRLEKVAHASENVLGKFRDKTLVVTPAAVSLILESLDRIKTLLAELEASEKEPEGDDSDLIRRLDDMALGKGAAAPAPAPKVVAPPPPPPAPVVAAPSGSGTFDPGLGRELKPGEVSLEDLEAVFNSAPGPESAGHAPEPAPAPVVAAPVAAAAPAAPAAAAKPATDVKAADKGEAIANQSIRVSVDLLENLMNMVSELVLSRNQLLQMVRALNNSEFAVPLQRLSHITTELQEGVMKTRMQPIGNAWAKLPRIIRDLSVELHKKIELVMLGAETELDRQVLELIKDPLTHMVRNSADHGLERPEERLKSGKSETGRVTLNAFHEGGHIIIEIKDDGRGLNTARIRQKAVENGLATEAELDKMTNNQIHQFIMKAGFSTAEKVTSVSGRGVGMDVVRSNIEKIGGTVEMKSEEGKGSDFTIKIPLTLAIVSALIVECGGEKFAIPQLSVVELVRSSANSEHKIERINETAVLRLRNRLLPLIFLDEVLQLAEPGKERKIDDEHFIVVAQVGSHSFGIVVDRVFDTEEIVVKPVAPILRDIQMFSGNTILGDGSVIMILDPNGVASSTGDTATAQHGRAAAEGPQEARAGDLVALLLFHAAGPEPKAVPLSLVARLEEIEVGQIEIVNGQHMVQYRGKLMPLVRVAETQEFKKEGRQPILVFTDRDRSMGLIVDEIVDIVESELNIEITSKDRGILGSAVIAGKATEITDVGYYLSMAFGDWFKQHDDREFGADSARRILLVDDSPFFLNMLTPLLTVAGFRVTTAENPGAALKMRENGDKFDLIVSDIEMPVMDGFAFVENIRANPGWTDTPVIALSSHTAQRDFDRGREAGFTDYVAKFDRDALLEAIKNNAAH